jgi:uncharacterized protein (TIGR00369 family)
MTRQPFEPGDPQFRDRVSASFDAQAVMRTLNAVLLRVEPGEVEIEFPYRSDLTQQDGFIHAGISSTVMDSACGYAAFTLMPAEARVLTIEFKVNLLAPAAGERFRAHGRVRKPGRSIFVAEGELHALEAGREKLVATMAGTLMAVYPR